MISAKNLPSNKKNICWKTKLKVITTEMSLIVYVCKHSSHWFPVRVSYSRFVELEKEILLPLTIFIRQVLLGQCTGISFANQTCLITLYHYHLHPFTAVSDNPKATLRTPL